jgi:hypothetical protein
MAKLRQQWLVESHKVVINGKGCNLSGLANVGYLYDAK